MKLDPDQLKAVTLYRKSNVLVITGGPGTGKTTVLSEIIKATSPNKVIALASPTAKAAKRLSEATAMPASTIHRLLAYHPYQGFQRNEESPIPADVVVIDEMSMVDIQLMDHLMRAIRPEATLVMVGDVDQLPSVGPGKVFGDIIDSGVVPTVRLRTIHRQAARSMIKKNAHHINAGESLQLDAGPDDIRDMWVIPDLEPARIAGKILASCRRCVEIGYNPEDVQILAPMKKGVIGTVELNIRLRDEFFNPKGRKISGSRFRVGDRVIQTKNDYDMGVFNGDVGTVLGADGGADGSLHIAFDAVGGSEEVEYPRDEENKLLLSYALTVHKSQGSEYPVVILPMSKSHYIMLKRNLLYTGVTRGKQMVVLIGDPKAISIAIKNVDTRVRHSRLAKRLREAA